MCEHRPTTCSSLSTQACRPPWSTCRTNRSSHQSGTPRRRHGRRRAMPARGLTTAARTDPPSSCPCRPSTTDARSPEVRRPHIAPAHVSYMRIESVHVAKCEQLNLAGRIAKSIRLPFNGFTYFLTLFSKSFSSFPHGTCSLSVSCLYLALDGVYHPFWAAFPNNPTLQKHIASARALPRTGVTLYEVLFQATWACPMRRESTSRNYNSPLQHNGDFQVELTTLHSPLLGESLLVSFPPLSNMLKISNLA